MTNRSTHILSISILSGIFALYVYGLPHTVQTGDTGELVANSFLYQVAHPSGYPLFINLQYALTHLFPFGTLFYRASFFNALFSMGALGFLYFSSRNRWFGLGVALCLAFSQIYWRYSELPDVFALNNLLAAGTLFFFLRKDLTSRVRIWGASLLFFLGLANHLTIVFLAPVLATMVWSLPEKKRAILPVLTGAGVCVAIYSSLMLMHPDRLNSWGSIHSPGAVLSHFLREDYGRSRSEKEVQPSVEASQNVVPTPAPVQPQAEAKNPPAVKKAQPAGTQFTSEVGTAWGHLISGMTSKEFRFYLKSFSVPTLQDLSDVVVFLLLFLALMIYDRRIDRSGALLLGVFAIYCYVFFALVKIEPVQENLEVVERFFIFPQLLLCFVVVELFPEKFIKGRNAQILTLILLVQAGVSVAQNIGVNNYSQNTIVEDYAQNFLKTTSPTQPSIILAEDDTQYFALKYAQQILGGNSKTQVMSAPLLFHSWYTDKIFAQNVGFQFNAGLIQKSRHFSLEKDLLAPNVARLAFHVSSRFTDTLSFRLTYLALGRRIEAGQGEYFDGHHQSEFVFRSDPSVLKTETSEYDPFRSIFSEYAYFHLAQGRALDKEEKYAAAEAEFLAAIQRVSYCLPAAQNLCTLKDRVGLDTAQCQAELKRLWAANYDYYSH
ncbi:MAG: protein O-mannosyl-transferase family [Bdellovibrionia bacterium]